MPDLQFILSDEDKHLISRLDDFIYVAENKYTPKFTPFLDERQQMIAEKTLTEKGFHNFLFFGGDDICTRKVLGLFPDTPSSEAFPIVPLLFTYRKADKLTHRDFLGSVMALGIKREMIGDIFVEEGKTTLFSYDTVSENIISQISKVGSVGVKISVCDEVSITLNENFKEIDGIVASLRADCIVSLATGLSRAKSSDFIKSNGIDVNYMKNFSPSYTFSEDDIFSIKGFGKFILSEIGGLTRKEKLHIKLKKYT